MSTIASLNVLLSAQTGPLSKGLNSAAGMVQGFAGRVKGIGGVIGGVMNSALGEIGVIVGAIGGIVGSLHKAEEASESVRKLDAVLAATGNTTGLARSQLLDLADSIERTTNFSHVAAEGAETLLASFHSINGNNFRAALSAAADLSAVVGGDLQENAMKIGRALENPIQGMTRLNRIGIGFSAVQEAQIKAMVAANNMAGAQGLILAGLQSKFAGAAAATANPFTQLQNTVLSFAERFGSVLLPAVEKGIRFIIPVISSIGDVFSTLLRYDVALFDCVVRRACLGTIHGVYRNRVF